MLALLAALILAASLAATGDPELPGSGSNNTGNDPIIIAGGG
jgi:hypothetical protein